MWRDVAKTEIFQRSN